MIRTSIRLRRLALLPAFLAFAPQLSAPALLAQAVAAPPAAVAAAPAREVVDPSLRSIDSLFAATYPATGPGAAVVVARDGRVLMRKAYGLADVELGVPMRPEHVFRVGSITKQFTAVGVLMLADEGKLSVDDEITRFFPGYPTHGRRITVEHLLTHTSGIRSYTSIPEWRERMRDDVTVDELVAAFRDQPMDFAPGESWSYNNSGYVLLGALIEKLSGQTYAEFMRARVFEPLGMRDTRVETQSAVIPRRVRGYEMGEGRAITNSEYLSLSHPYAAGALVSTVDDLLRWGQAVQEGRMLKPETWRRAHRAFGISDGRTAGYGHGWFVGRVAGRPSVEHGGDINGFSSDGVWIPSERLQVYVLSNVERNFANPGDLSNRAAERALGYSAPAGVTLSAAKLDEYVGVYRINDTDRRVVTRDGDKLFSQRGRGTRQEMRALGNDQFVYASTGTRVTFAREGGRVTGMRLHPRIGPEERPSPRTDERPESVTAAPVAVAVAPEVLDAYVGEYQLAPNFIITIRRDGASLKARATGQPELTLVAQSETRFAVQEVDAALVFERGPDGKAVRLQLIQGGRTQPAQKIR
jgi:D-alanyl-D-alanine carboxypeptidase